MSQDRDQLVKEIFGNALEKANAAERAAYLAQACANDAPLRQQVEALLHAHTNAGDFLAEPGTPSPGPTIVVSAPPTEKPGDRIGRYKLREQVGEGGCGVVYVADQEEPIRRRVALKVIKLGMDTKQVVARFEAERQALALMDHPNIAKVLDAGATDTGRPYFVMELVRGIKITDYCDQNNLATEERLALFAQVCHAVQHAHQKGIIHRDLKPSNILVTLHDGVPVPKVIDFGIAKATEGRLTDATVYTQLHQFVGTPAYMSPEQAEMSGLDIDTRSDIYSLGVLLYELLAGSTPFDPNELMSQGVEAMRKTIREKEPPRPSTRFATLKGEESTTTAKRRSADKSKLMHQLKGDLDWIVMKCLEKDRTRRYETANGLAHDIQCHLNNEPVLARPPSRLYRFQKLVRRNKLAFAAASAVVLALSLGFIFSAWQAVRAKRAEARALQTRNEAEKLSNFILDDLYKVLEPTGQLETLARINKRAVDYYSSLPVSLWTSDTARNRVAAQAQLAFITAAQGKVKDAMPLAKEAAATLERMRQQGDQSEGTLYALGQALHAQSWCGFWQGDNGSARISLERAAEMLRPFALSVGGSRPVKLEYAFLLNDLSSLQPPGEGMVTCQEGMDILARLGALDLSDLSAASSWADIADSKATRALAIGRVDEAEQLEKKGLELAKGVLEHRPADLDARMDLFYALDGLARVEATRFHDDAALQLATQSRQAAQDYLRFNPSDALGLGNLIFADYTISALLFRGGRVGEALQKARAATQSEANPNNVPLITLRTVELRLNIACWEAQRANREAADQALQEAQHSYEAISTGRDASEKRTKAESFEATERQVRLAFGEDAKVYSMSTDVGPRLAKLSGDETDPNARAKLLHYRRQALEEAARAALHLGRYADAEAAAHELLSLQRESGSSSMRSEWFLLDQPYDKVRGQVLLAQAEAGQGRKAEALKTLEPALARYRDDQAQGAAHLAFRQHFARALYVQALAQPTDTAGTALARESLNQALALLQGLSDEARQLHDSKELLTWITAAQGKLAPTNEQTPGK